VRKSSLAIALALLLLLGGGALFVNLAGDALTGYWSFVNSVRPHGWAPAAATPTPTPTAIPKSCGSLNVRVLNVGQADAIFIRTPGGKTILLDAGDSKRELSALIGSARIDYFIATHYHQDHIGGYEALHSDVGAIYDNGNCGGSTSKIAQDFLAFAKAGNHVVVAQDMPLKIDDCINAKLIVAYDRPQGCWKDDENQNSILLRITYGKQSFLFAADCGTECENTLIQQATPLSATVLKVGHHGSATSSSAEFLRAIGASYYVISVNATESAQPNKKYFHPRQATLSRIYARSQNLARTDLNGNVHYITDGNTLTTASDKKATQREEFSGFASASADTYGPIPEVAG